MAEQIITRVEAKAIGAKYFYTGEPCKNGHVAKRNTKSGTCVICSIEISKQYRDKNKVLINARKLERYKKNPEKFRAISLASYFKNHEAGKSKNRNDYAKNIEKRRQYAKDYRKANPDVKKAQHAVRRARKFKSTGSYKAADVKRLLELQKGKCACCYEKLKNYHVDHIMPLALGGANNVENIQILCPICNMKKSSNDPYVWANRIGRLL